MENAWALVLAIGQHISPPSITLLEAREGGAAMLELVEAHIRKLAETSETIRRQRTHKRRQHTRSIEKTHRSAYTHTYPEKSHARKKKRQIG